MVLETSPLTQRPSRAAGSGGAGPAAIKPCSRNGEAQARSASA